MSLKICSWNILAPELLFYFWRSSYGLEFKDKNFVALPKQYYDDITNLRLENIINYLRTGEFDIILLQEVTTTKYVVIDGELIRTKDEIGLTLHELIAGSLGFQIVSESFKKAKFSSGIPPYEQHKDRIESSTYSGVATLARPELKFENITTAEGCKNKTASPFTLDRLISSKKNNDIFIGNVHIKMNYPHIFDSVVEIYDCINDKIGENILRLILMGDFNAHALAAATELYKSSLGNNMFDIFASQLIDDHVFVGNQIRLYESKAYLDKDLPMLEMQLNTPATGYKWIVEKTQYEKSKHNQNLINKGTITTDHSPIIIEFDFSKKRSLKRSILV
jgi:hypothetical protein